MSEELMSTDAKDLNALEAKVREEYTRDGSLEFLMGFGITVAGLMVGRHHIGSFAAFVPIFVIMLSRAWKKTITYPRLGYAEFSAALRAEKKRTIFLVILAAAALAILAALSYSEAAFSERKGSLPYANLMIGGFIALFFLAFAIYRKATALYIIAGLMIAAALAVHFRLFSFEDALVFAGCVLMAVGVVRVVRFIRSHPRLEESESHDSR
jgi:hypothetical protein